MEEEGKIESLTLGRIASFYYLKYQTLSVFTQHLQPGMAVQEVCFWSVTHDLRDD